MKFLFALSGDNPRLASGEIAAVCSLKKFSCDNHVLVANVTSSAAKAASRRLAYTGSIGRILFESSSKQILKKASSFAWPKVYRRSFSVRIRNLSGKKLLFDEKSIAALVWRKLRKPKVNLENPSTAVELFVTKNKVYCCLLIHRLKHDFESRKPQFRPGFSPVSLHPRLARAIVNLTGIKKGSLLDPFCGTGGLLIEAGLMGFKPVGYDIEYGMLIKCKKNLSFYGIKNCSVSKQDATKLPKKAKFVATDLPYGQSSRMTSEIRKLYSDFLKQLKKRLTGKAVVVFPDFCYDKGMMRKARLKIIAEFDHYIHKSLTKKIAVMR